MQAKAGSNSLILANFQVELVHFIAGKLSCILAIKTPNIFSVPWEQSDDGGEEPILPKELLDGGGSLLSLVSSSSSLLSSFLPSYRWGTTLARSGPRT